MRPGIRAFSTKLFSGATREAGLAQSMADSVSYLTQREAAEIDETLMGPLGFSVDQLMVTLCFSISSLGSEF